MCTALLKVAHQRGGALRSDPRSPHGPAFTLGRIRQARSDVIAGKLREFLEELLLGHAAGQVPEDVADRNPSSLNTRLPEPDARVDADALKQAHEREYIAFQPKTQSPAPLAMSRMGLTVLASLHDLNLAALFFPRLVMLREGKIYRDGPPKDVLTEETIQEVYGVKVRVQRDASGERPQIFLSSSPPALDR